MTDTGPTRVVLTESDGDDPISKSFTANGPQPDVAGVRNMVDGIFAIAQALNNVADALRELSPPENIESIEEHANAVREAGDTIAEAITSAVSDAVQALGHED